MKRHILFFFLFISGVMCAQVPTWLPNSDKTKISFELPGHKGSFTGIDAKIKFDEEKLDSSSFYASLDPTTINTGDVELDQHLMSPDYLGSEKFPEIIFESTKIIKNKNGGFIAIGKLTIRDITLDVEMPFIYDDQGGETAGFHGLMTISAVDFGIMKADKKGKDVVKIRVDVPAKRQ